MTCLLDDLMYIRLQCDSERNTHTPSICHPTTNGSMQSGSRLGIRTRCMPIFCTFCADLLAQSVLINKISASELSRKFIKGALLVGQSLLYYQVHLIRGGWERDGVVRSMRHYGCCADTHYGGIFAILLHPLPMPFYPTSVEICLGTGKKTRFFL